MAIVPTASIAVLSIISVFHVALAQSDHPIEGTGSTGLVDSVFLRVPGRTAFADNKSLPLGSTRKSPRFISNTLAVQQPNKLDGVWTALFPYFGQLVDHDITLSSTSSSLACFTPGESFNIPVPDCDATFDPLCFGVIDIGFSRTSFCTENRVRQVHNGVTSILDASMVYGSKKAVTDNLRLFRGGKLKTDPNNMLPDASTVGLLGYMSSCVSGAPCFATGDTRGNENIVLSALQTVMMREHNRLAVQAAAANPTFTDEQLFQAARRMLIAEWQFIVFNEFLNNNLLADKCPALNTYNGFNASETAQINVEFATSAFRHGHSAIPDTMEFHWANGSVTVKSLADEFFNPSGLTKDNIGALLEGVSNQPMQTIDSQVVDSLRNLLFAKIGTNPSKPVIGADLVAFNIQRGRDHGVVSYNDLRAAYGLPRKTSFSQVSSDPAVVAALSTAFNNNVNDADAYIVGLSEDRIGHSLLGELNTAIVCQQFVKLRDADPWWYQVPGRFSPAEIAVIESTKFGDLIARNLPGFMFSNTAAALRIPIPTTTTTKTSSSTVTKTTTKTSTSTTTSTTSSTATQTTATVTKTKTTTKTTSTTITTTTTSTSTKAATVTTTKTTTKTASTTITTTTTSTSTKAATVTTTKTTAKTTSTTITTTTTSTSTKAATVTTTKTTAKTTSTTITTTTTSTSTKAATVTTTKTTTKTTSTTITTTTTSTSTKAATVTTTKTTTKTTTTTKTAIKYSTATQTTATVTTTKTATKTTSTTAATATTTKTATETTTTTKTAPIVYGSDGGSSSNGAVSVGVPISIALGVLLVILIIAAVVLANRRQSKSLTPPQTDVIDHSYYSAEFANPACFLT